MDVLATEDPAEVLRIANGLLLADPIRTNVIGTLLHARVERPGPGRYWIANPSDPVGVACQSPLDFPLTITPMPVEAVDGLVDTLSAAGVSLPGVGGEAGTAARFAGSWSERNRVGAVPLMGQRLYEVDEVVAPSGVGGSFRQAVDADTEVLVRYIDGFGAATGERTDAEAMVAARLPLGRFWVWDHDGPVSMAALSGAANGVVRVQGVFTPDDQRGHGYASACVAALSEAALAAGQRCMLYTDLGNATSNAIYRAIGYRAVAEALRYTFG